MVFLRLLGPDPQGPGRRRRQGWVSISVLWHLNILCVRLFTATVDHDGGLRCDFDLNVFERTRLSHARFQFVATFYVDNHFWFWLKQHHEIYIYMYIYPPVTSWFFPLVTNPTLFGNAPSARKFMRRDTLYPRAQGIVSRAWAWSSHNKICDASDI